MTDPLQHRKLILMIFVMAVIAVVALFLEPLLGVLWVLLCALVLIVYLLRRPQLLDEERNRLGGVKGKMFGAQDYGDDGGRAAYELVVVKPATGERFPIQSKSYTIGRSANCDLTLRGSTTLGREHCRIVYREHSREYYIEDLRSKNGTYLGTRRLEPNTQVKLLDNAEIFAGDYCLRFERQDG